MLPVTALFASLLTLLYIKLAFDVIRLRKRHRISLGSGDLQALERAIRIHGNFGEYVPLGLILLGLLEFQSVSPVLVAVFGGLLLLGRLFHAHGLASENFKSRFVGMLLTLSPLAALALTHLVLAISRLGAA